MGFSLTYNSFIVAELDPQPSHVYGIGGSDFPRIAINIPVNFLPFGPKHEVADEFLFFTIRSELFLHDQPHRIAESFQPLPYQSVDHRHATQIVVDFPLDRYRVERIEQERSGDVKMKIRVQVAAALNGVPRHRNYPNPGQSRIYGFQTLFGEVTLLIPGSLWIERVLPGLGYGLVTVIELPAVGLEAIKMLEHSYAALRKAEHRFKHGDYDEAVAFCRTAIDPVRDDLRKIKANEPNDLGADWAEKVGNSTVDWLTSIIGKTHGVANKPHHSPRSGYFSRLDAQMILTVTTSVLAFVGRRSLAKTC